VADGNSSAQDRSPARREGRLVRACEQRGDEFHEPQDRHRVEEVEPDDLLGAADSRAAEETAPCLALTD